MKKILFAWIGHADLQEFAENCPEHKEQVEKLIRKNSPREKTGPTKVAIDKGGFDRVVLLWNYKNDALIELYRVYCGENVEIVHAPVDNPVDYKDIYEAALSVLQNHCSPEYEPCYLLSPGTATMATIWVLLGKTKFVGRFFNTYKDELNETQIPFDIAVDIIPDLLKKREQLIESLPNVSDVAGFEDVVGNAPSIRKAVMLAAKAAIYSANILLTGESGTGKESFANAIQKASSRNDKPFVKINCAAITATLLESELFGHKKGAFTGANEDYAGAFKRADGGTLFLDEIGECSLELQAKLLRVLQPPEGKSLTCREFTPIKAKQAEQSDVRIIAATNRNLLQMIADGQFRDDLYYRLSAITLHLPPLRERKEDIPALAEKFLNTLNKQFSKDTPGHKNKKFCRSTINFIKKYDWTGNVRELYNAVLRGVVMSSRDEIEIADMGLSEAAEYEKKRYDNIEFGDGFDLDKLLADIEKRYTEAALKEAGYNQSQAARMLGYSNYQRLAARAEKLGIEIKKK